VGIKKDIEPQAAPYIPGPPACFSTRRISTTGGYTLEGKSESTCQGGRTDCRRPHRGGKAEREQWIMRRLDQGIHDPIVMGVLGQEW